MSEVITSEQVSDYIIEYVNQDIEKALPVVIGLFVGLVEGYIEMCGEDKNKQITLDSQREIIIGPVK